jgi:hypothetical protein
MLTAAQSRRWVGRSGKRGMSASAMKALRRQARSTPASKAPVPPRILSSRRGDRASRKSHPPALTPPLTAPRAAGGPSPPPPPGAPPHTTRPPGARPTATLGRPSSAPRPATGVDAPSAPIPASPSAASPPRHPRPPPPPPPPAPPPPVPPVHSPNRVASRALSTCGAQSTTPRDQHRSKCTVALIR